jgi:hypothetical protein
MAIKPAVHQVVRKAPAKKKASKAPKTRTQKIAAAKNKVVAAQKALKAARAAPTVAPQRVGLVTPNAMLLNDRMNTCALLAWWNACIAVFGKDIPTPDDELVAQVYASLGHNGDNGLYLESVLDRASHGLFGYRLLSDDDTVLIGSAGDHAYGGLDALGVDLDDAWWIGIEPA